MEPFTPWDAPAEFFTRKMEPMAGKRTLHFVLGANLWLDLCYLT